MKKHLLTIENIWPMRPDSVSHATASVWFTPGYGISELWKATQRMASRPDFDKLIDCSLTTSHAFASVRYDEVSRKPMATHLAAEKHVTIQIDGVRAGNPGSGRLEGG